MRKTAAHLEQVSDFSIVVDDLAHSGDQADHLLGHVVGGGSLAAKDADTGHKLLALLGAGGLDLQVAVDDGEHVQVLALVLMDALDLHIVHGVCGDVHSHVRLRNMKLFTYHVLSVSSTAPHACGMQPSNTRIDYAERSA